MNYDSYPASAWRKSRKSNANDNCVEINVQPRFVGIRDSKAGSGGPILSVSSEAFTAFVRLAKSGQHDLT